MTQKRDTQYHASGHAKMVIETSIIKQPEHEQLNRLLWLTQNEFILKPNYEWRHIQEKIMVNQSLVETATVAEWDRLIDGIEYFFNND